MAAYTGPHLNLRIIPDQTEADLTAIQALTLSTFSGQYIIAEDTGIIYYIQDVDGSGTSYEIVPAYNPDNWSSEVPAEDDYIKAYEPAGEITYAGMYTEIKAIASNGLVTFYPTDDGLVAGDPIFDSIKSIEAVAILNTSDANEVPLTFVQSYTTGAVTIGVVEAKTQVGLPGGQIQPLKFHDNTSIEVSIRILGVLKEAYRTGYGS